METHLRNKNKPLETERLHRLEDRFAIQDLLSKYCYLLDNGRSAEIPDEIFTEDVVENHGTGDIVGRDSQRTFFSRYPQVLEGSAHNVTNVVITVDGDTAQSLANVLAFHWLKATSHLGAVRPCDFLQVAIYEDQLRREDCGWRIARRIVHGLAGQIPVGTMPSGMPMFDMSRPRPMWPIS